MGKLTVNPDSGLSDVEVKKLEKIFAKLEDKVEKLKPLEKAAEEYFDLLYELGEDMNELSEDQEHILLDGDEDSFYVNEDNPLSGASGTFGFWVPSSMEC